MNELQSLSGNWNYPTSILFGAGRIKELASACQAIGINKPLLVTDQTICDLPILSEVINDCHQKQLLIEVYSDVQANPIEDNISNGVMAYQRGCHDGVIAFGGGSALDAGKAIALMVGQTRSIWDFEDREDWYKRVNAATMAKVIAVPTTAGTGSEVGRASVITDLTDKTKKIIFHPNMMPIMVIADPELTLALPAKITAAVGMDALSHNLEAFCSPVFHPMAHGIALQGIKIIKDWLEEAVKNGNNLQARAHMLIASTMGATAFQKGLGAMHSLSHPLGAVLNLHHGLSNAIVMPYVLEFNQTAIDNNLIELGRYLGLENPSFQGVFDWILKLRKEIGIPATLAAVGITESDVKPLTPMAIADPSTATNPLPLTIENTSKLYLKCVTG